MHDVVLLYYCTGRAEVTKVTRAFKIECNSFVNNYSDYGQAARMHTHTCPLRNLYALVCTYPYSKGFTAVRPAVA